MNGATEDLPPLLAARRDALVPDLAFRPPFPRWQARLRRIWRNSLPPHRDPPAVIRLAESERPGGLHLTSLHLTYATGGSGEAALLRPAATDGRRPGILLLHDHGGRFDRGWRKMIPHGSAPPEPAPHYEGVFMGEALARQGHVVLCADAFGWGTRQYGGHARQQAVASQALRLGWSLAGIVAAEDLQALQLLASLPGVDPGRIGVWGFSFGGFRAFQAAALSGRVRAVVALSWMGRASLLLRAGNPMIEGHSAFYTLHPALAGRADFPDLAGLAADRALFLRVGTEDRHFPAEAVRPAFADLRAIAAAAGGVADCALFAGPHLCPRSIQDEAARFLRDHL